MQGVILRMWFVIVGLFVAVLIVAPLTFVAERIFAEVQDRVNRTPVDSPVDRTDLVALPFTTEEVPIAPSTSIHKTLVSGLRHTCAVTSIKSVLCWGDNSNGQLGIGVTGAVMSIATNARPVVGLTDVIGIAVGEYHSCAIRQAQGDVWCWGDNQYRQLGNLQNGPQSDQSIAMQTVNIPPALQVVSGANHTCVLTTTNDVWCWGDNQYAQVGFVDSDTSSPQRIDALPADVISLSAGMNHTCAQTLQGTVWCWGDNRSQQIDDSTDAFVVAPRQIYGELTIGQIGLAQSSTCIIDATSALYCRGRNQLRATLPNEVLLVSSALGQMCAITKDYQLTCWDDATSPQTQRLLGATMVSSGDAFMCVLLRAGLVQCRGDNRFGQVGQSLDMPNVADFVFVSLGSSRQFMSAGYAHICSIWQLGKVLCWGRNLEGQLGLPIQDTTSFSASPHEVALNGVLDVVVGGNHSCAIRYDQQLSCWGDNTYGQLGTFDKIPRHEPTLITSLVDIKQVALGINHTCVLISDGRVACWGDNRFGQTANTVAQHSTPAFVSQLQGVVRIAAGGNTSCALQNDGVVVCWGSEIGGQPAFVPITSIQDVVSVSVGFAHACAVQITGVVVCWGDDSTGFTDSVLPHTIDSLPPIRVVSVGGQHTCALDTQRNVWCWGDNSNGQVNGEPSTTMIFPPELQARGVSHIVTGLDFTCVRQQIGTTACWGANRYGQLGADNVATHYHANTTNTDGFAIAAGGNHSCVILSGVAARCWGGNEYGQLGDATTNSSTSPQTVRSAVPFVSIAAGLAHTCVVVNDATVRCWGHNNFGQLGNETTENANTPVVTAVQDVRKLALGNSHTCAILIDGGAACWGRNEEGQLGVGGTANSAMPLRVADITDAVDIASGSNHVCVVRQDGTVWCWGSNTYGQLGTGEPGPGLSIPTQVTGISNAVAVGLGDNHSCVLTADTSVWCWGRNNYGQVGAIQIDETANIVRPQQIAGLTDVAQLYVGGNHNCVLTQDASAFCWGDNFNGQLGNPTIKTQVRSVPTAVAGISRFVSLAVGSAHTCGLLQDGDVTCWGWNRYGQIGNGSGGYVVDVVNPSAVVGLEQIRSLAVGASHFCASDETGQVYCWGDNAVGQLGLGVFGDAAALAIPQKVNLVVAGLATSVGLEHSCALLSSTELSCWGRNEFGQIGNGSAGEIADTAVPNFVLNFIGVTDFASGGNTNCAILAGEVYCWGDNQYSQVGQSSIGIGDFRVQPTKVELLSDMRSVVVGKHHACALSTSGIVYCWGRNNLAQLGGFNGEQSHLPSVVSNLSDVVQISAGDDHTCAVTAQQTLVCWGSNSSGQIGIDAGLSAAVSTVPMIPNVQQVATGAAHTCAFDGTSVVCWGRNNHGQLGTGVVTAESDVASNRSPVRGIPAVSAIQAGGDHSCVITAQSNEVWCWGQNENAQLGVTNNPDVSVPVAVIDLWSMQVNQSVVVEPTILPTARMPRPTQTTQPTSTPAPTATLIRPRSP